MDELGVTVPLRHYIERRIDDHAMLNDREITALKRAIEVMKADTDERFKAANEWRSAMKDKDELYARCVEVDKAEDRIAALELWSANLTGKIAVIVVIAMTIVSIVTALVVKTLTK
jgi:hypothetical protein